MFKCLTVVSLLVLCVFSTFVLSYNSIRLYVDNRIFYSDEFWKFGVLSSLASTNPYIISTRYFDILFAKGLFDSGYHDRGTGAKEDLSTWRPVCDPGFISIADVAIQRSRDNAQYYVGFTPEIYRLNIHAICIRVTDPAGVQLTTQYYSTWDDKRSGGSFDGSFWAPICPGGYSALGHRFAFFYGMPSNVATPCFRNDLLVGFNGVSRVWWDKGSGASRDGTVWNGWKSAITVGNYNTNPPPALQLPLNSLVYPKYTFSTYTTQGTKYLTLLQQNGEVYMGLGNTPTTFELITVQINAYRWTTFRQPDGRFMVPLKLDALAECRINSYYTTSISTVQEFGWIESTNSDGTVQYKGCLGFDWTYDSNSGRVIMYKIGNPVPLRFVKTRVN